MKLGDSITTDHISPGGKIAKNSPAARFLESQGVSPQDFNIYSSRRGNDLVMRRGAFANIRLINQLASGPGPLTLHIPSGKEMAVFDASELYLKDNHELIIIAGKEYGAGSSRDWAARGPLLLGVKAVIAESFERIHRSNLIGMGILPLQFKDLQNADSFGITGKERFTIKVNSEDLKIKQNIEIVTDKGISFEATARIDTEIELEYYKNNGFLPYVLRKLTK